MVFVGLAPGPHKCTSNWRTQSTDRSQVAAKRGGVHRAHSAGAAQQERLEDDDRRMFTTEFEGGAMKRIVFSLIAITTVAGIPGLNRPCIGSR